MNPGMSAPQQGGEVTPAGPPYASYGSTYDPSRVMDQLRRQIEMLTGQIYQDQALAQIGDRGAMRRIGEAYARIESLQAKLSEVGQQQQQRQAEEMMKNQAEWAARASYLGHRPGATNTGGQPYVPPPPAPPSFADMHGGLGKGTFQL